MVILRLKIILIAIFFAFMIIEPANAFNLGTLQKSNIKNAMPGDNVIFEILFWNSEKDEYTVTLDNIEFPKNWIIISNPSEFYLGSSHSGKVEKLYIPKIKKTIDVDVINIYIRIPENEKSGKYTIILKATAENKNITTSFLIKQERKFEFNINVLKNTTLFNESDQNIGDKNTVNIDMNPDIIYDKVTDIIKSKNVTLLNKINKQKDDLVSSINNPSNSIKLYLKVIIFMFSIFIAWRIYAHD